jgi:hypothetical protein
MTNQLSSLFSFSTQQPDEPLRQETDGYRRRIQKLPRRIQQVFLLSRLDQMTYTGIAQLLDVKVDAVERCMVRLLEHCSHEPTDVQAVDTINLQAHRWYVHLQSPQATASQRIEFRHWLDADAAHLRAFQETERLWCCLETPAAIIGANGWHRRKRRIYLGWLLLTAFLCSVLVTAEAFT